VLGLSPAGDRRKLAMRIGTGKFDGDKALTSHFVAGAFAERGGARAFFAFRAQATKFFSRPAEDTLNR